MELEFEKQANEKGFTLGNKAKLFEKIWTSCDMLYMHEYLTDGQNAAIRKKIQKNISKSLKPLSG